MVKLLNTQQFKRRTHTKKSMSFRNTWVSVVLDIFEISEAESSKTAELEINSSPGTNWYSKRNRAEVFVNHCKEFAVFK